MSKLFVNKHYHECKLPTSTLNFRLPPGSVFLCSCGQYWYAREERGTFAGFMWARISKRRAQRRIKKGSLSATS